MYLNIPRHGSKRVAYLIAHFHETKSEWLWASERCSKRSCIDSANHSSQAVDEIRTRSACTRFTDHEVDLRKFSVFSDQSRLVLCISSDT